MDEQKFRKEARKYRAELDGKNFPSYSFGWSARLLNPFVRHDGEMIRQVCATVTARTWLEAGVLVALYDLRQPPERQVTDVLISLGKRVGLAWGRGGRLKVMESETLKKFDDQDEADGLHVLPMAPVTPPTLYDPKRPRA